MYNFDLSVKPTSGINYALCQFVKRLVTVQGEISERFYDGGCVSYGYWHTLSSIAVGMLRTRSMLWDSDDTMSEFLVLKCYVTL
jgi:hypothetical protein